MSPLSPSPWLQHYDPHVPAHLEYPDSTLPELLRAVAQKYFYRTALIFKGARLTYRELYRLINRFAAGLQQLGVKPGDRVAVHLPNCPQFIIAYYAIQSLGAVVVPCNPIYQAHEMTYQLRDSGARVILTLSNTYPLIRQIRKDTPLEHVIVAQIKTYFPAFLRALFELGAEKARGHKVEIAGDARTYWFTDVLKKAAPAPKPVPTDPSDLAILMYTGGTTGVSKGAMLTHHNLVTNIYQCKAWLNAQPAEDIFMVQLPLFHAYAMTTCMNFGLLMGDTLILIPDPRDLDDVVRTIFRYKPTVYPGVPAIYASLVAYPDIQKYRLNCIKACVSGAAGLPLEVQKKFEALTGARLIEGYGLSEAGPITHGNPFNENRVGTVGVPWPDVEVKLVDIETGTQEVPLGEPGEICVRGRQIMQGYWNMPNETASALRPDPEGGAPWLYTGDIATMSPDGYFTIVDRKKEMILGAGGYNIYPREIEEVLYEHPKVLEAAAVGVPAGDKGERVKAFVVLRAGETATADEIIQHCTKNLAAYKVPKAVAFRDSLPKSLVGKVLRRQLLNEELGQNKPEAVNSKK